MDAGRRRLLFALALIALLMIVGTAGYMLIEHMTLGDALFMTVITISTVGYGQVRPLDGVGRIFTIGLTIFTGGGRRGTVHSQR